MAKLLNRLRLLVLFAFLYVWQCVHCCEIIQGNFASSGASLVPPYNLNSNLNTQFHDPLYTSGNVTLYYKLYVPDKASNSTSSSFPALVLIHGSGPNNHDEEVYINTLHTKSLRTFYDIANYLCDHNIVVFTYDKRSCPPVSSIERSQPGCFNNTPAWCAIDPTANPCLKLSVE